VLTMHQSEEVVAEVLKAGARGYVLKSDADQNLVAAMEALLQHKPFLTSGVTELVLSEFLSGRTASLDAAPGRNLTPREREIIQLLAEGKSNKEVAVVVPAGLAPRPAPPRPPPPPKLPATGPPRPPPRGPPPNPPSPRAPAGKPPGKPSPGTLDLDFSRGMVFEMLMLLSKRPGPTAELRAMPSGRALVTPSLKLSYPVVMLYGRPPYNRNCVLTTTFPGKRPLMPIWK